ncbi:MAG: stage II sporulation protein R, partial [Monoglobaceae bacterium]
MQSKLTRILFSSIFMSIIFMIFTIGYVMNMKTNIEDSVLRLHIIGASDSACDQELKLCVRNRILSDFSSVL